MKLLVNAGLAALLAAVSAAHAADDTLVGTMPYHHEVPPFDFALAADAADPLAAWNQLGYDLDADEHHGGSWRLHLDNVDSVSVVPEPSQALLLVLGLVGMGLWFMRRRSDDVEE